MFSILKTRIGMAVALAIAIIGISVAYKYRAPVDRSAMSVSPEIKKIVEDSLDRDDDGDKLKNWEESLYKTDPSDPDTDKDGTSDGDEVALGQSPTETGRGTPEEDGNGTSTYSYTATDRFSQELFREYIRAKESGLDITSSISDRIAERVLAQDYSDVEPFYSYKKVTPLADKSVSALKDYGNSMGEIFSTPPASEEPEIVIFQRISTEPVADYAEELTLIKARYEGMRAKLMMLAAPEALRASQADIVNALSLFIDAVDGALTMDEDPIGALGKISRYDAGMVLLKQSITVLEKYFSSKRISFSQSEKGYMFMR